MKRIVNSRIVVVERLLNSLGNACLPAVIALGYEPVLSAQYFLLSIGIQMSMQLNYINGIEYKIEELKVDEHAIGLENFWRAILPLIIFFAYSSFFMRGHQISWSLVWACAYLLVSNEVASNYRFYLTVVGRAKRSMIWSVLLTVVPLFSIVLGPPSLPLLLVMHATALVACLLFFSRDSALPMRIGLNLRGFFSVRRRKNSLYPLMVWFVARADRLVPAALSIQILPVYIIVAAISDTIFAPVRQSAFIQGRISWRVYAGALLSWCGLSVLIINIKQLEFSWMLCAIPVFPLASLFVVGFFIRRRNGRRAF